MGGGVRVGRGGERGNAALPTLLLCPTTQAMSTAEQGRAHTGQPRVARGGGRQRRGACAGVGSRARTDPPQGLRGGCAYGSAAGQVGFIVRVLPHGGRRGWRGRGWWWGRRRVGRSTQSGRSSSCGRHGGDCDSVQHCHSHAGPHIVPRGRVGRGRRRVHDGGEEGGDAVRQCPARARAPTPPPPPPPGARPPARCAAHRTRGMAC